MRFLTTWCWVGIILSACRPQNHDGNSLPNMDSLQNQHTSQLANLPNNKAGNIIRSAIKSAGGWQAYVDKETFSFYKVIQHFDSAGKQLKEVRQLHQYRLKPLFQARISWSMDGHNYLLVNDGSQAFKYIDGKRYNKKSDVDEAWNTSYGSHYVIFLPFKLADSGTIISYEGIDTLSSGAIANTVKVDYKSSAGTSGGYHTWWYHFSVNDNKLLAHTLDYGEGVNYTEYEEWAIVDGIRFGQRRSLYPVKENDELGFKKSTFIGEDLTFGLELPDNFAAIQE